MDFAAYRNGESERSSSRRCTEPGTLPLGWGQADERGKTLLWDAPCIRARTPRGGASSRAFSESADHCS